MQDLWKSSFFLKLKSFIVIKSQCYWHGCIEEFYQFSLYCPHRKSENLNPKCWASNSYLCACFSRLIWGNFASKWNWVQHNAFFDVALRIWWPFEWIRNSFMIEINNIKNDYWCSYVCLLSTKILISA